MRHFTGAQLSKLERRGLGKAEDREFSREDVMAFLLPIDDDGVHTNGIQISGPVQAPRAFVSASIGGRPISVLIRGPICH